MKKNTMQTDYMARSADTTKSPESLVLHLSNGQSIGLAWFTVAAYELIPGDEPEIYIHAGHVAYILRFSADEPHASTDSPSVRVFKSLCKRDTESLKVRGPLLSILLSTIPTEK